MILAARERERLGTGECVLGAGMGLRVGEGRARDCGDVVRIDEGLCAITGRNRDCAIGWLEEGLTEVLYEPRRPQNGVGEPGRPSNSSSTRRMAVSGGAESVP